MRPCPALTFPSLPPAVRRALGGIACVAALALWPALAPIAALSTSADTLMWMGSVALSAWLLRRSMPPGAARPALLALVLAWLLWGVGLAGTAAVALWACGAWGTGRLMLRWLHSPSTQKTLGAVDALLVGGALWLALAGGLLHLPVNTRTLHLLLCALPPVALLCLPGEAAALRAAAGTATALTLLWLRAVPYWAWAAGLALLGWCLHWAWLPSASYDDHALHLRLWSELLAQRRAAFDVQTQIWAVAPFASDALHAALSLLAGADARGARNLALALATLLLLLRLMHRWSIKPIRAWMLVLLFASTPMFGQLLLTLQTELFLATLALAGMAWTGTQQPHAHLPGHAPAVLAAAALCAATKLPGAVMGAALIAAYTAACALVRRQRAAAPGAGRRHWLAWGAFLLALTFVALHSYVLAWVKTGNPFFPLYNGIFQSPAYPAENFSDTRYAIGCSLVNYVRVFFDTSKFAESSDYAAGWQYLFIFPLAALALLRRRTPVGLRLLAVPVLGFGLAMFAATQYWRYMFPVLPLASVMMAALFLQEQAGSAPGKAARYGQRALLALALVCLVLNMLRFTKISALMRMPPASAFTAVGRQNFMQRHAPAAYLTQRIPDNAAPDGAALRVLYPESAPAGALLRGTPLYLNWYTPARRTRFAALSSPKAMAKFLQHENIDYVIFHQRPAEENTEPLPDALLRQWLARYGRPLAAAGEIKKGQYVLYRTSHIPAHYAAPLFTLDEKTKEKGVDIDASSNNVFEHSFQVQRARQALLQLGYACPREAGTVVVDIAWDARTATRTSANGSRYRRTLACRAKNSAFIEALPIPSGTQQGTLKITATQNTTGTPQAHISAIAIHAR